MNECCYCNSIVGNRNVNATNFGIKRTTSFQCRFVRAESSQFSLKEGVRLRKAPYSDKSIDTIQGGGKKDLSRQISRSCSRTLAINFAALSFLSSPFIHRYQTLKRWLSPAAEQRSMHQNSFIFSQVQVFVSFYFGISQILFLSGMNCLMRRHGGANRACRPYLDKGSEGHASATRNYLAKKLESELGTQCHCISQLYEESQDECHEWTLMQSTWIL